MKRITVVCLALAALSGNAFAGDAYTAVMGSGDPFGAVAGGGTFYTNNAYNIFYNPSYANDFKNWAIVERNSAASATGGFVSSMSNMSVGAFLNRNSVGGTGLNLDPLDVIIAGDAGMKWGVNLSYGSKKYGTDNTDTAMAARVGLQIGDIHPFVGMQITGADKNSATVTNKTTAMNAGFRYMFGEWTPYAYVASTNYTPQGAVAQKSATYGAGVSRSIKAGDMSSFNYSFGVHGTSAHRWVLPIDMTFETEFTSWLVGRAGLNHRWIDRTNGVSNANNTTGRAGGTLKFGKAEMEFAVGGSGGGVDSATFDFANGIFTAANFTYRW